MESRFKQVASLIGDPTRATVLWVLLDGKAFTATELAIAANTSPQNMSMHLNKLLDADLLSVESQGRHKYYKYASKDVAYAIEAMANLLPPEKPAEKALSPVTYCRTCYDHLAGKIGVQITDSLLDQQILTDNFEVSKKGEKWFKDLGLDLEEIKQQRRSYLRPCLDWSERRYHIAGALPAALLDKMLEEDWIRRTKNSRAVVITAEGQKKMRKYFKL
jgi:DNA-binding transcriptional ArsR family regulator